MTKQEEFYEQLDEMGEAAVDRQRRLGHWTNTSEVLWVKAWLREQQTKRENRAVEAAEASGESAKYAARWAMWAVLVAVASVAWSVWGP